MNLLNKLKIFIIAIALSSSFSLPSEASILSKIIGVPTSSVLAGGGYTVDGIIYAIGGIGVFVTTCGPLVVAMGLAGGIIQPTSEFKCLELDAISYKQLHKHHPKLGRNIWESTQAWRE